MSFFLVCGPLQGDKDNKDNSISLLIMFHSSSLRVAETVWMEGVFLKEFPPEADTIKNLEDAQAFLATEGAQQKFEGYVKSWMKKIQV